MLSDWLVAAGFPVPGMVYVPLSVAVTGPKLLVARVAYAAWVGVVQLTCSGCPAGPEAPAVGWLIACGPGPPTTTPWVPPLIDGDCATVQGLQVTLSPKSPG